MGRLPDYAMRLQLLTVADFLSTRSPSSVVFNAEFTSITDGGPIARVTLQSLGLSAKTTLTLPTIICAPLQETAKINTHKVRPCHVSPNESCDLCSRRLLRTVSRARNLFPGDAPEGRANLTGNISATDCGGVFHSNCLQSYRESPIGHVCPRCPTSERKRILMEFSPDRSFINLSGFELWLERHLPLDFTTSLETPSLCCMCIKPMEDGYISQPHSCDCFAHYDCAMQGLRDAEDSWHIVQCKACAVYTRLNRRPGAILMTRRGGRIEESELHQE
jgi:hypothetical protein